MYLRWADQSCFRDFSCQDLHPSARPMLRHSPPPRPCHPLPLLCRLLCPSPPAPSLASPRSPVLCAVLRLLVHRHRAHFHPTTQLDHLDGIPPFLDRRRSHYSPRYSLELSSFPLLVIVHGNIRLCRSFDDDWYHLHAPLHNIPLGALPPRLRLPDLHPEYPRGAVQPTASPPVLSLLCRPDSHHQSYPGGADRCNSISPTSWFSLALAPISAILLPRARGKVVDRLPTLVSALPGVESCSNRRLLRARTGVPKYASGDGYMEYLAAASEIAHYSARHLIIRLPLHHSHGSFGVPSSSGPHSEVAKLMNTSPTPPSAPETLG
ncbi:hypothetical protein C8R46DRAFT_1118071 [Mycena filopes]|nr:hypothetical protein C8R46DRAFT_1118071 [Mycena filopes]